MKALKEDTLKKRNLDDLKRRIAELESSLSEERQKTLACEHAALHDSLTGLPNRRQFEAYLQQTVATAAKNKIEFAVGIIDLNRFKLVNDEQGHSVGDGLLQKVSKRLRETLREMDFLARFGGDEFGVILHESNAESCKKIALRIGANLRLPFKVDTHTLSIGGSLGIALYPQHGENKETLVDNADAAMYQAKRASVDFAVYDLEEDRRRALRLKLLSELDFTIQNNALSLNFQPIFNLQSRRITGVEALCRWQHPNYGWIPPDRFIPLAEHKGMIQALTLWVLETALAECASLHRKRIMIGVSVNLSTRNFLDPELSDRVNEVLNKTNVEPEWLCLEITESMTLSNPDLALTIVRSIDKMGVRIAIDDFGTGYSSLAYLKKLPVHEIKLDRSFVIDMDKDKVNRTIAESTIGMAHALKLSVVAEGIESKEVMALLTASKCDMGQGFHLCHPLDSTALGLFLRGEPTLPPVKTIS